MSATSPEEQFVKMLTTIPIAGETLLGLPLRDVIAISILLGWKTHWVVDGPTQLARDAYELADAMIKERVRIK